MIGVLAKGTDWTAVGAWAAWVTVVIYIAVGIFALMQVREARRLREEQARPFVIVDTELAGFLVYLTVENIGRTIARDVSVHFDKPLESTLEGSREIDETPLFRETISALPPGKKFSVLFDSLVDRGQTDLPLTYQVMLSYQGPTGKKLLEDVYRLDLGVYFGSRLPPKGVPEVVAELEKIREEIQKWKGSGLKGLEVHSFDQIRQRRIEERRRMGFLPLRQNPRAFARRIWQRALRCTGFG